MPKDKIQVLTISEFRGNFPDVPIASGVDLAELKALDPDPLFVTLPVVPRVGSVSKNGLLYDEALVKSIETQINDKRPGGRFGHLKDEERDTAFPIPDSLWMGAKRDGETLWAKAYIPPGAARDHVRRLKAVGGKIATSIYGRGQYEATDKSGVRRLTGFDLESLDFAPPERAALGYAAAPIVTSEMETDDMNRDQIIAELQVGDIPAKLREQIIKEAAASNANQTQISELAQAVKDRDTLVSELQTKVAEYRKQQFAAKLDARIAELTAWQVKGDDAKGRLEAFRRTLRSRIVSELGDAQDDEKVSETIDTVWADLKPLAETVRDALAGPPAIVSGKVRSGRKLEQTPEAVEKARAAWGV